MQPNILKETVRGIQTSTIEDELFNNREIFLIEAIDVSVATSIIKQLMYLDKVDPGQPITLYINSPGGHVDSGLAIYDYMNYMKSPVNTVCIGLAASMASVLFLAGKKRKMFKNSQVMIHDPSYASESISGQKPCEIQEKLNKLIKTQQKIAKIIADRTNMSLDTVLEKTKYDTFIDANEAIQFNIATEILEGENEND